MLCAPHKNVCVCGGTFGGHGYVYGCIVVMVSRVNRQTHQDVYIKYAYYFVHINQNKLLFAF